MEPDRGGIVLGWLARITITLSLLGLAGFEVLSIAVTHVTIQDIGSQSADAALTSLQQQQTPQQAYQAAAAVAEGQGATIPARSFRVNTDGTVSFQLHKTAPTLVLYRISLLRKYAEVTWPVTAGPLAGSGTQS